MGERGGLMAGLGLALVLAMGGGVLVAPELMRSRRLVSEIESLRVELSRPNSGPEVIGSLESKLGTLNRLRDERMKPIPADRDVAGLMRELSEMLASEGITDREITTGSARVLEEASVMPMTVTLRGRYEDIASSVRRMESLPRLVRVQRLHVEVPRVREGGVNRSGVVEADIRLEVFFAPRVASADVGGGGGA